MQDDRRPCDGFTKEPLKSVFIGEVGDHGIQGSDHFRKETSCVILLVFGSISSAIYTAGDGNLLLSSRVVTAEPLRNGSLGSVRDSPPFRAK